jgi:hypothetical protein
MRSQEPSVALVTSHRAPWQDQETPRLQAALVTRGVHASLLPWHENADWSTFDLIVIRSPWDCFFHVEEFFAWLAIVDTAALVLNSAQIIRWAMDKHYLNDLAAHHVPTVPTNFVEVGQQPDFPNAEFIIKPVINGGSTRTARYAAPASAQAFEHVAALHADGVAAMIQPYVTAVDVTGEHSLIFYEGQFDHAVTKQPLLILGQSFRHIRGIEDLHPQPKPYTPSPEELALACGAIEAIPDSQNLLAGRVDIIVPSDGPPVILELELIGPVLFYGQSEGSLDRLSDAIIQRISRKELEGSHEPEGDVVK